jgi:tetratricopeptide (TPR) repeat protein
MNQSLQFALEAVDDVCIGCAYRGFGEIYNAKGEILLEKQSFQKAIEAFDRANDDLEVQEIVTLLK